MKMVAAAKLRKAQDRLHRSTPYAERMAQVLAHIAAQEERGLHPLLEVREPRNICYLTVSADRGLCGSFNANTTRRAKSKIDSRMQNGEIGLEIITVGRKAFEFFSRRDYDIYQKYMNFFDELDFQHAVEISDMIQKLYIGQQVDRVLIVYNHFKSAGSQETLVEQLLPIQPQEPEFEKYELADYLYEPSVERILAEICPRNLNIQIWRILLDSYAAEQSARMIAMDNATENAEEMIYDLTLYYNKVRQAAITKEIAEIVGGAEALRS